MQRAEIIVGGLVQGVGFRRFVERHARELNLSGYTENLESGEVRTVAEGEREQLLRLYEYLQQGPFHARVAQHRIEWQEYSGEFEGFGIRS